MTDSAELRALLRRAAARDRRRRVVAAAVVALVVAPMVGLAMEFARLGLAASGGVPWSLRAVVATSVGIAVAGIVWGALAALRPADERSLAREIDRRLGLDDRAATALAAQRGELRGALVPAMVAESAQVFASHAPRIDVAFVAEPRFLSMKKPVRWSLALWALLLALLLVDLLRLLDWPFGLLGGRGDAAGIVPGADKDRPPGGLHAPDGPPGPDGGKTEKQDPDPSTPTSDPAAQKPSPEPRDDAPERPATRDPGVEARLRAGRERFDDGDPVNMAASVLPTERAPKDRTFEVSISVDGKPPAKTHARLPVGPSAPTGSGEVMDLRRIPGLAEHLGPGEHTAVMTARDEATGESVQSKPVKFTVVGPPQPPGAGGGPQPQPPQPSPSPNPPTPQPPSSQPPSQTPPSGASPPPRPELPVGFDLRVVVPLIGKGDEITKRSLEILLAEGGATPTLPSPAGAGAQAQRAIDDAEKRTEQQVDAGAVRERDREVVRRYFDALREALR